MLAVPAAIVAPFLAVGVVRLLGALGSAGRCERGDRLGRGTQSTVTASVVAAGLCIAVADPAVAAVGRPARPASGRRSAGRSDGRWPSGSGSTWPSSSLRSWRSGSSGSTGRRSPANARGVLGVDPAARRRPGDRPARRRACWRPGSSRGWPRSASGSSPGGRGVVPPLGARQRRPPTPALHALRAAPHPGRRALARLRPRAPRRGRGRRSTRPPTGRPATSGWSLSDYPDLPGWAVGSAYRAVPGVTAATPVSSQSLDVGRTVRDGRLVGLDPGAIELDRPVVRRLARRRPTWPPSPPPVR